MTAPDNANSGSAAAGSLGAVLRLLDRSVTDVDLAAGAEGAARVAERRSRDSFGVLLFRLGKETLAVPAKVLRLTTPYTKPAPIPGRTTGLLRGLCNIRGELALCADLRRLLGLEAAAAESNVTTEAGDNRRMVVIGPAEASWAFAVDGLIGVERIDENELQAPPMTVEHAIGAFVMGLAEIDGVQVTVLDGERILDGFKAALA